MQEVRKNLRRLRRSVSQSYRYKASKSLLHQCQKAGIFNNAKHIASFIPNDGEIETRAITNFLISEHKKVYYPIIKGEKLKFARVINNKFKKNRFGISEPILTQPVDAKSLNVILMPLVAFDKNKNRMGMGGGFYDKTLAFKSVNNLFKTPKIFAIAFDFQEVEALEANHWDIPADGIITPTRIII
mgnify:CR=1 FL=1